MNKLVRKKILGIGLAIILLFGSLNLRLGNIVPDDIKRNAMLGSVNSWHTVSEREYIKQSAKQLNSGNIKAAQHNALTALTTNYTSGIALIQLLKTYKKENDITNGDKAAVLASKLWPAEALVRAEAANYWIDRGNLTRLLPEWNSILIRRQGTFRQIFPALQELVNSEQTFPSLLPYIQTPPVWWNSFFNYLVNTNGSLDSIKAIYAIRASSDTPLTSTETNSFIKRLIREKLYQEAHYIWLNSLDSESFQLIGSIHDGGFEGKILNNSFGWQVKETKGLKVHMASTSGITGNQALKISLDHKRLNFRHISQRLNLPQGRYQLQGRYRLNRLRTTEGLRWRLYCEKSNNKRLGRIAESKKFKGRQAWQEFTVDFDIRSDECISQLLRLEASSSYRHHHAFKGILWFDDFKIQRKTADLEVQDNE